MISMKMKEFIKFILGCQKGEVSFFEGADPAPADPAPADPAPVDPSADPDPAPAPTPEPTPVNTGVNISAEVLQDPGISKYVKDGNLDVESVARGYLHAQKLIGKDKVVVPDKDFTDDQWGEFYDRIGRPAREEYKVENNVPEGIEADEKAFNGFLDVAHSAGILPKQAQAVADYYNELIKTQVTQQQEYYEAESRKELEDLQKEWGEGFARKQTAAEEGLKQFADSDQVKALKELGVLNNATVMRVFAKIGEALSSPEDGTFTGDTKKNYGQTPEEIKQEIAKMYQRDDFTNKRHPNHADAMKRFLDLQAKLHGNTPVMG